jgi:hypothetical protein
MSGGLIGGIIGAAIGFMVGMPQIGFMVGSMVGNAIDPPKGAAGGPKLTDLHPQSSEYGRPIPIVYGTTALAGNVIWAMDLIQHEESSGGKGGSSATSAYSYTANWAVAICEGPKIVARIYAGADKRLIWDPVSGLIESGTIRVYSGDEAQMPDPLIEQDKGAGNAPAYRGTCYIVFEGFQLKNDGNTIPFIWVEVGDMTVVAGTPASNNGGLLGFGGSGSGSSGNAYTAANVGTFDIHALRTALGTPGGPSPAVYDPITDQFWQGVGNASGWTSGSAATGDLAFISRTTQAIVGYSSGETTRAYSNYYPVYSASTGGGGCIYWIMQDSTTLRCYNATTGHLTAQFTDTANQWFTPMVAAKGGGVWVAGQRNSDGAAVIGFIPNGAATPSHVIVDPDNSVANCAALNPSSGELYYGNSVGLLKVDPTAFTISTLPGWTIDPNTQGFPLDMAYYPDGGATGAGAIYVVVDTFEAPYYNYLVLYDMASQSITANTQSVESPGLQNVYMHLTGRELFTISQPIGIGDQICSRDVLSLAKTDLQYTSPGLPGSYPTGSSSIFDAGPIRQDIPAALGASGSLSIYSAQAQNTDLVEIDTGFSFTYSSGGTTGSITYNSPSLGDVLTDLHRRSGMDPTTTLNLSLLPSGLIVDGYVIAKQTDIRATVDSLRSIFWFDAVESDAKVKIVPRGGTTAYVIPDDDLAAFEGGGTSPQDPPDPLNTTRQMETELPRMLTINYQQRASHYQGATKYQKRYHTATKDGSEQTLDYSGVLTDEKAQAVVDCLLYSAWSNRLTYKLQVSAKRYAFLEPTDLVVVHGNTMKLTKVTREGGWLSCEAVHENVGDYAQVYAQHAVTDADTIVKTVAQAPATVSTLA